MVAVLPSNWRANPLICWSFCTINFRRYRQIYRQRGATPPTRPHTRLLRVPQPVHAEDPVGFEPFAQLAQVVKLALAAPAPHHQHRTIVGMHGSGLLDFPRLARWRLSNHRLKPLQHNDFKNEAIEDAPRLARLPVSIALRRNAVKASNLS